MDEILKIVMYYFINIDLRLNAKSFGSMNILKKFFLAKYSCKTRISTNTVCIYYNKMSLDRGKFSQQSIAPTFKSVNYYKYLRSFFKKWLICYKVSKFSFFNWEDILMNNKFIFSWGDMNLKQVGCTKLVIKLPTLYSLITKMHKCLIGLCLWWEGGRSIKERSRWNERENMNALAVQTGVSLFEVFNPLTIPHL